MLPLWLVLPLSLPLWNCIWFTNITSRDLYNREKDQKKIPQQQNCCCAYLDRNIEAEKATNETQNQTDVCSKENMNSIHTRRFYGDGWWELNVWYVEIYWQQSVLCQVLFTETYRRRSRKHSAKISFARLQGRPLTPMPLKRKSKLRKGEKHDKEIP